ncbi:Ig-like domain-containing protein [Chitinophaga sancti]|uniref:Ig-like domain-containing protein n=1 Tax=Chitinophaga sancti TaxID=1004 RepID=UPI003F7A3011
MSDNENTSFAKLGDVVTLTFIASSDLPIPQVTIAGHKVSPTAVSYLQYTASWTMTNTDTEGEILFNIVYINNAGDTVNVVNATTDNSKVYFDMTRPTSGVFSTASSPVSAPFSVSISFSEAISTFDVSRIILANATLSDFDRVRNNLITAIVTPLHDGQLSVQIPDSTARDQAGNPNVASVVLTRTAVSTGMFDKIYPNPASSNLIVKYLPAVSAKAVISLVNYNGLTVYEKEMALDGLTVTIDVSRVPSGMYMLYTRSKDYSFYTNVVVAH